MNKTFSFTLNKAYKFFNISDIQILNFIEQVLFKDLHKILLLILSSREYFYIKSVQLVL